MSPGADCSYKVFCVATEPQSISGRLVPVTYNIPIDLKFRIGACLLPQGTNETGQLCQLFEVMGVSTRYYPLVRQFIPLELPSDASLEGTFNGVTRQVVCAGVLSRLKEQSRLPETSSTQVP